MHKKRFWSILILRFHHNLKHKTLSQCIFAVAILFEQFLSGTELKLWLIIFILIKSIFMISSITSPLNNFSFLGLYININIFCPGEQLPDMEDLASIYVNLGNIFIKKGLFEEAKKSCAKGWKLSKSRKNDETLNESKACLDEVEKLMTS